MKEQVVDSQTLQLLHKTAQLFANQNQPVYLVGGSLRNLLLNQPIHDWDLVVTNDPPRLARHLADQLGGFYAHMNENASRVIVKQEQEITFDLAPLKGGTLIADLQQRDFTINAMAASLPDVIEHLSSGTSLQLTDPLHGAVDLERHLLRAASDTTFQESPQRLLRAVRIASQYQLTIENQTKKLLQRDAHLLNTVAKEIVHEELFRLLTPSGALQQLHLLDELDLLTILIPEFEPGRGMRQPPPHYWDVLEHSLQTVHMLEQLTHALRSEPGNIKLHLDEYANQQDFVEIQALLADAQTQGIFQLADLDSARMKFATLLHDIGKPETFAIDQQDRVHFYGHPQAGAITAPKIMKRLGASTQECRLAQLVAAHHMRPGQLGQVEELTLRAIRRYFVDLGATGIPICLISLADHLATNGPQDFNPSWGRHIRTIHQLLTSYIRQRESIMPPRLLSPEELMRRLKLAPGPIVGQLLTRIADAQTEGTIHSKEEALWLAEEFLQTQPEGRRS